MNSVVKTLFDYVTNPISLISDAFLTGLLFVFKIITSLSLKIVTDNLDIKYELINDPIFKRAYIFFGTISISVIMLKLAIEFMKSKILRLTNVDYLEFFYLAIINLTFIIYGATLFNYISQFFDLIISGVVSLNLIDKAKMLSQLNSIDFGSILLGPNTKELGLVLLVLISIGVTNVFVTLTYFQQVIRQIKIALLFLFIPFVATQNMGATVGTYQAWKQEIKNLFGQIIVQLVMYKFSVAYLLTNFSKFTNIVDFQFSTIIIVLCLFYYTYKVPEFIRKFIDGGASGSWIDTSAKFAGNVASAGVQSAVSSAVKSFIK